MADTTTFNQTVVATRTIPPKVRPARVESSRATRAGRFVLWAGLVTAGILALAPITQFALDAFEDKSLALADDAAVRTELGGDWLHTASADKLETLSELSLQLPTPDTASAYAAAQKATQLDPSRAFAWANLAWLESQRAGGVVRQPTIDALTNSMDACGLCDQELIRWRFNFVLANWNAMPETLRRRAFEQADLLRWMGSNAEFLADMRLKAGRTGIPFDSYAGAVSSPVRDWKAGALVDLQKIAGGV